MPVRQNGRSTSAGGPVDKTVPITNNHCKILKGVKDMKVLYNDGHVAENPKAAKYR